MQLVLVLQTLHRLALGRQHEMAAVVLVLLWPDLVLQKITGLELITESSLQAKLGYKMKIYEVRIINAIGRRNSAKIGPNKNYFSI